MMDTYSSKVSHALHNTDHDDLSQEPQSAKIPWALESYTAHYGLVRLKSVFRAKHCQHSKTVSRTGLITSILDYMKVSS